MLLPQPRSLVPGTGSAPAGALPTTSIDAALPAQGYRLEVTTDGVTLTGCDQAGLFYGRATLDQLHRVHGPSLPAMTVLDWPDVGVRGAMLDISRDKVPTLATVKDLVARLASWKVNHLQLYTEHTFAYAGHEAVWQAADPFTADEIADLDAWCAQHHVELAPNQNCLGHMERWLALEPYRRLAIAADGWVDDRGRQRPPTTLDPANPASMDLVTDLLGQLLPHFTSGRVNVGLDEPWELPAERHDEYLAHIAALRAAPVLDGREMLMWGDIVALAPELAPRLPAGVTVCEWGYEASHPFEARAAALAATGLPFWLCPGTSSWNSILGRTTNMIENCRGAAAAATAHGASGFLVTDWGDYGHLQYLPVSEPGLAFAAAVSWCGATNADLDLAGALDRHAFDDSSGRLGAALLALGDAHRAVVPQLANMSILALPLYAPTVRMGEGWTEGMTDADLAAAEGVVAEATAAVARSQSARSDAALVRDEVAAGADLITALCRDARARLAGDGTLAGIPGGERQALADAVRDVADRHRELWLARNRPGGLADSVARLDRLEEAYRRA